LITIHKIRYQNFLSAGNIFTEIQLDDSKNLLVAGKNGSGKSTLMDAITFVLYGKAFRKINKPQLVNSIRGKGLLVEIEMTIDNDFYMIRRGIKRAVFEIHKNGEMLNQDANSRDYQEILEKNILKMSYKTFCQIVILGNANFTPFMQLSASARRNIIEDLLDIEVFSIMNSILKQRINNNKSALIDNEHDIKLLERTIELNEKHKREKKKNNTAAISRKQKEIGRYEKEIGRQNEKIGKLQEKCGLLKETYEKVHKVDEKLSTIDVICKKLHRSDSKTKDEIAFYSDSDSCPTCEQEIDQLFKQGKIQEFEVKLETNKKKFEQATEEQNKLLITKEKLTVVGSKISELNNDISTCQRKISELQRLVQACQQDITDLQEQGNLFIEDDTDNKKKLKSFHTTRENIVEQRELFNIAGMLLKDSGIKTQIIRQYIPIMNKLIKQFLEQMEFFCQFNINENFEETIKSRYRDEFTYTSFSEGEKMRIDLALLFTWREISKMRNASPINLLILDEIMDSSLDASGTEEFLNIIGRLTGDNNVVIISHKHDQIADKFDKTIKFEKVKNFSRIAK
jgi:DNA repair exonuclease SbcCD ATPase subunit